MIDGLRGARLLRGYRGTPHGDEHALRKTLLQVSALVDACPDIAEFEINPVKVLPKGVIGLDVRVRIERRPLAPGNRRVHY